jgi:hypothetical protein
MDGSKGHNFRSDRWIAIKLSLEFPDALFHALDEESILGDNEVWSSHAYSVMMRSGRARLDGLFERP